jgi:hypothetical protein
MVLYLSLLVVWRGEGWERIPTGLEWIQLGSNSHYLLFFGVYSFPVRSDLTAPNVVLTNVQSTTLQVDNVVVRRRGKRV